jgi:hypothetical protein
MSGATIARRRGKPMATAVKVKSDEKRKLVRPELEALLVHPIRKTDNDPADSDIGCYEDWLLDHSEITRFYVGGFASIRSRTRRTDAKYHHSFVEQAAEIAHAEGWAKEMDDGFKRPASYNQFRNAIVLFRPMYFDHAVQVILACECALAEAINQGRYDGERTDVFRMMKIIPATYNVDALNEGTLAELRAAIENYDSTVLAFAGQRSKSLLDHLAEGHCVTRRTARAIRSKTLELLKAHPSLEIEVGDVRGRPGKKKLGCLSATTSEDVELDDLAFHQD